MHVVKIAVVCPKTIRPLPSRNLVQWVLIVASLVFAGAAAAAAQSVTLAWDPSPDPSVTGYYLCYGTVSGALSERLDAGNLTRATVDGLLVGETYYFALTAYNAQRLESQPTGEIAYTVPAAAPIPVPVAEPLRILPGAGPSSPPRLQFRVPPAHAYNVQASADMRSWKTIHRSVSLTTNWLEYADPQAATLAKRFYRLMLPEGPLVPGVISLVGGGMPGGSICLRPRVAQGQRYQIQASQDLRVWTTLHDAVCAAGQPLDFVDVDAASYATRYYRLALLGTPLAVSSLEIRRGSGSDGSRLRVAALEGQRYRVEASWNLKSWRTIHEGISTSDEPVQLLDTQARFFPRRFYRLAFD